MCAYSPSSRHYSAAIRSAATALPLVAIFLCWQGPPAMGEETPACADCHDAAPAIAASVHGEAGLECVSCHTDLAEVKEMPHGKPAAVQCLNCHDVKVSTHHPPGCADCHGSHAIERPGRENRSRTGEHLSKFCGNCHEEVVADFFAGIHGSQLKAGNPDVPTCFTCHGVHAIVLKEDPASPINHDAQAGTCTACHDDEEIAAKYKLPSERLETFTGSFHGLASAYGDKKVASCGSCHGAHRILPSSDSASSIHPSRLKETCGACHPQAGTNFGAGKVHLRDRWEDNPLTWVARRFYRAMITGMMAIFAVYMAVDLRYRFRLRSAHKAKASRSKEGGRS